jgi:hypothetical protein
MFEFIGKRFLQLKFLKMLTLSILLIVSVQDFGWACGAYDVEDVFSGINALSQYGLNQDITINSVQIDRIPISAGQQIAVLDGSISLDSVETPCLGVAACADLTVVSAVLGVLPRKYVAGGFDVYKIHFNIQLQSQMCIPYWEDGEIECRIDYANPNNFGVTIYTPADNPHPIYDYLVNRYEGGCIMPLPNMNGDPPDMDHAGRP